MTCREFKHSAAALTLWELSRNQDETIRRHIEACESCSGWLQKQRALAASMQTLQSRTAGLEAGPDVERALLRAFRQAAPRGVEERTASLRLVVAPRSTPLALRMSRIFEIGAYAAVAAAVMVGVFLGVQLLRNRPVTPGAESQVASASNAPVAPKVDNTAGPSLAEQARRAPALAASRPVHSLGRSTARFAAVTAMAPAEDSQSSSDDGYMALMFCDPLSCSSESQVVRMELPGSRDAQPQVADVVVGYDGMVRAVRIVN